jgi:hypothetical protein
VVFRGFFYFVDDHYLYLSYAQQAEQGAFLLRNKLVGEEHAAALINLEWWLVGTLARALGGRPFLAYRLVGLLAALFLLLAVARLLQRGGLSEDRLLPSLLLVFAGGGFGGLLLTAGWLPRQRCLDFSTGLFPFVGLLANAHFTVASALFVWSLLWLGQETRRGQALGVALATALALVRPYDFVTLVSLRLGFVASHYPWREWLRRGLPLVALLPAALFNYWVFYRNPAFAFYANAPYVFPATGDLGLALGPAALVALLALRAPWRNPPARETRLLLLLWCGFGALVILARPVYFSLQFLMGLGLPILVFAALGLARLPRAFAWAGLVSLSTSALVAFRLTLLPLPYWFTPREHMQAAAALAPHCQQGDIAFAPVEISLFLAGLTPCKAYVSHVSHPDYAARAEEAQDFYATLAPAARASLLDRGCIRHVLLPGDDGPVPQLWLGSDTPFERSALVGAPPRQISIYTRAGPPPCRP